MLQFAVALTAATAAILVSVTPASAAPTAPDAATPTVSSAAGTISADLPSAATGYTSDSVSASAASAAQLRGPACRNWSCGWAFTKAQTRALFLAVTAGGAVAGAAACARLGGVTAVACNAAVAFVVTLVVQGVSSLNRCLYISLTIPGRHQLYSC